MAVPTNAPMAQNCDLPDGYIVRFAAVSPTDGSAVTGVVVSNVSIFGTNLGSLAADTTGAFMLVPGPGA
jgi:hypothetical protein